MASHGPPTTGCCADRSMRGLEQLRIVDRDGLWSMAASGLQVAYARIMRGLLLSRSNAYTSSRVNGMAHEHGTATNLRGCPMHNPWVGSSEGQSPWTSK
jgi:hypothetical protein